MKKNIVVFGMLVFFSLGMFFLSRIGGRAEASVDSQDYDRHGHGKEEKGHDDKEDSKIQGKAMQDEGDHRAESEGHAEGAVELDNEAQEMIQLKADTVEKRSVKSRLKVFGKISQDTERSSYVTAEGEGVVEEIKTGLGALVEKGDLLFMIRRTDGSVQEVHSNEHGVALAIYVKVGDKVDRLKSLMSIVGIDKLRATVDVYEKDIGLAQVGQRVEIESIAFSGKKFNGEVVYISPHVDESSQSIKVRVDIDNPDHLLRLGMFVSGEIIHGSDQKVLTVPLSAVQELKGEEVVFVVEGGNKFSVREIALGRKFEDYAEIEKGLQEGEKVVTHGSFNLKSEQAKESLGDGHGH
jgi:multidrug efflux pump subunit AcrA (membrane-fusion protein)